MIGVSKLVILLIFIVGFFCNYIKKTFFGTQKLKVLCIPLLIAGDIYFQSSSHPDLSFWITLPLSEQADSLNSYFTASLQNADVVNEMRYEWLRLRSYSIFPLTLSQSPVRLARSGFYFTGRNQECVCFSCGVHNSNWTRQNITELHRQLSPDCRHLRGSNDSNVPIGSRESWQSNNLHNFNTSSITTNEPAECSLQRSRGTRRQQYDSCNAHTNHHSQPPSNSQPNRLKETLEPLGIVIDRPRYPSYAVMATRVSSYQQWPSHLTQTPRDLSLAGFFYVGYGDYVRCFFCGGGLRNWEPGDDAWIEHARWFPKCPFLIQNQGQDFVRLVQNVQEEDFENNPSQEQTGNLTEIEQLPAAYEIYQMGYTWNTIKEAYRKLNKKKTDVTTAELIEEILASDSAAPNSSPEQPTSSSSSASTPEPNGNVTSRASNPLSTSEISEEFGAMSMSDETRSLMDENRKLKEQRLCRICMEEDVAIAFLPCGHLCCCSHCAPAIRKCPICRAFIKGTVKTYPA
ncbi:baculoviral IAP repeat-containing protein 7-like [Saccostrea echinata]|uniref:baculoviral IAP repeat-containing protein 7-like n=1 Tax=Saccostrea echinata TaxID=191078 RepID=UPI002A833558|nr:baculoviral IAP repeat-containing protein 7-like [Saccostrea echinata]